MHSLVVALALGAAAPDARLLVLDVEAADAELGHGITKLVVTAFERADRFDVVAGDDVRRALNLEAERQAAGCDTSSCLEEIAGAMGAQLVVFGDVGAVGSQRMLTLNLFDTAAVRSIARTSAELPAGGRGAHRDVVERLVRRLVRDYDSAHGAFPASTAALLGGGGGALAGVALGVVGAWQLVLLGEDQARHDRLVKDFERDGDAELVDEARDVQRAAQDHALAATGALTAATLLATAGVVGLAWGAWSALE